ncbi:MAG: MarR family transcriptional regulator [Spirochaetaceae bacterium]|jgi:predicted transcriptional regulator|nr:MarR family transcriptional regulator [Spirochaetaceae bacterium]
MRYINGECNIVELFKALDSEPRLSIIRHLYQYPSLSMNELAEKLGVTHGAITGHIKTLAASNLIFVREEHSGRGTRKRLSLNRERIQVDLAGNIGNRIVREEKIPIGSFTKVEVKPPCGIASAESMIGTVDTPSSFSLSERNAAEILWIAGGFVEYAIPIPGELSGGLEKIEITMEISSEAPGTCEEWPSDISFIINGKDVGTWTSPGDYGAMQGQLNPPWWDVNWNQYGLQKRLSVTRDGTYMDDLRLSDCTVDEIVGPLSRSLSIRFAVPGNSKNPGGLTLFGEKFGNYPQPLAVRLYGG